MSLRTVTRTQGNNAELKAGAVQPDGYTFAFEEVPVLVNAFRRMVRGLEFDVCEMAITTYVCAREHGVAFTAVPVFLVRGLHHGAIVHHVASGLTGPKDLEGRRVGVNRGYTVTTGVWARGILADEYGVDLDRVTWARSGDEHVAEYRPPENVESLPAGSSLEELLTSGELPAAVGAESDAPGVEPLIRNPEEAGFRALSERGLYPINHLVVIRDELLAAEPRIAVAVFEAFAESKRRYVERLAAGALKNPTPVDRMHERVMQITGSDPLPYGIDANRAMLEQLLRHATAQRIIRRPVDIASLFADGTRELAG